jgi:hypothetical protein
MTHKVNKRNIPVVSFHLAQLFPRGRACTIDAIDNFENFTGMFLLLTSSEFMILIPIQNSKWLPEPILQFKWLGLLK